MNEENEKTSSNKLSQPVTLQGSVLEYRINKLEGFHFPSMLKRVQAIFIDFVLLLVVFMLTSSLFDTVSDIPDWLRGFVLIFMFYIYDPIFVSAFGGTIGHNILGMRVRKFLAPKQKLSIFAALLRFLFKIALGWLSFLTVTSDEHKRAIHDKISRSVVILK